MTTFEEEEEPLRTGPVIGYCNRGPLYRRPAPYIHRAVSNRGELGTAFPRIEKEKKLKKKKSSKRKKA